MAKTKNYSIRFDEEKLKIFQNDNPNLKTPQQVIDFFLDEYWWDKKNGGKYIKIYKLSNPVNNEVFYIGLTSENLNIRLNGHISNSKKLKTETDKQIVSILKNGVLPSITIIEELIYNDCYDFWDALKKERKWIETFISEGHPLTNRAWNPKHKEKLVKGRIEKFNTAINHVKTVKKISSR